VKFWCYAVLHAGAAPDGRGWQNYFWLADYPPRTGKNRFMSIIVITAKDSSGAASSCYDLFTHSGLWFYYRNSGFGERLCQSRGLSDLNLWFSGDISLFSDDIRSRFGHRHLNS
jgi:hypothetical protein